MTAATIDRSFIANHTFACALRTRGGVCDCWPDQAGSTESDLSGPGYIDARSDFFEHCAICGRTVAGFAHEIVDLDGIDRLCERCFLQAEQEQLADARQVVEF